jgi:hypothetical protein
MLRLTTWPLVLTLILLPILPLTGVAGGQGTQYAFLVACSDYD